MSTMEKNDTEDKTPFEKFCFDLTALKKKVTKWEKVYKLISVDVSQPEINAMLGKYEIKELSGSV